MKFIEHALAHQWCRGEGLEIGAAAHNRFGLLTRNAFPGDELRPLTTIAHYLDEGGWRPLPRRDGPERRKPATADL